WFNTGSKVVERYSPLPWSTKTNSSLLESFVTTTEASVTSVMAPVLKKGVDSLKRMVCWFPAVPFSQFKDASTTNRVGPSWTSTSTTSSHEAKTMMITANMIFLIAFIVLEFNVVGQ